MTIEFDGQNNKLGTTTADSVTIKTNDTDALTVDSSQKIGIGTSSPTTPLTLDIGTNNVGLYQNSTDTTSGFSLADNGGSINLATTSSGAFRVLVGGDANTPADNSSEALRIDSSGTVQIGSSSSTGSRELRIDTGAGSTVGQDSIISSYRTNADLIIKTNDTERMRIDSGGDVKVVGNLNPSVDNGPDIGTPSLRWDDIYATSGTVNTSDQNEKQSIQSLTASEMAVAQRISKLFKTFKFNSSVEEKGDSARTHTGIIAQDVQQAFTDEGLDANNYGLFCSDTWWENEEGDIKEEATEGYTERTRLGIRYPELLSFVSSAFEQRLTNIETRLEALENV